MHHGVQCVHARGVNRGKYVDMRVDMFTTRVATRSVMGFAGRRVRRSSTRARRESSTRARRARIAALRDASSARSRALEPGRTGRGRRDRDSTRGARDDGATRARFATARDKMTANDRRRCRRARARFATALTVCACACAIPPNQNGDFQGEIWETLPHALQHSKGHRIP